VWAQLANLNALVDLVQNQYEIGETTIDRKIGREHQLLEIAATAPAFAKLNLGFIHHQNDEKHDAGAKPKVELQDSEKLQHTSGEKGHYAQN
ncbi:MAG: hypothetical protein RLZ28_807, partial [Actinomycetota bacterium]|jgi:hypothetical protein